MLHQRRAAFDPISVVEIMNTVDYAVIWGVDVTADHAIAFLLAGFTHNGGFKARDEFDRLFHLVFEIGRQ